MEVDRVQRYLPTGTPEVVLDEAVASVEFVEEACDEGITTSNNAPLLMGGVAGGCVGSNLMDGVAGGGRDFNFLGAFARVSSSSSVVSCAPLFCEAVVGGLTSLASTLPCLPSSATDGCCGRIAVFC